MSWDPEYRLSPVDNLSENEDGDFEKSRGMRKSLPVLSTVIKLLAVLASLCLILALLVLGNDIVHPSPPQFNLPHTAVEHPMTQQNCGSTPDEARRRGCIFDTISFSWSVPECYDAELVRELDALKTFRFFEDPEGRVGVPMEEVEKGERSLHVTWEHHLWHCAFMWRKLHRAALANKPIDSYIGNYAHTQHCGEVIIRSRDFKLDDINSVVPLKFPYCNVVNPFLG